MAGTLLRNGVFIVSHIIVGVGLRLMPRGGSLSTPNHASDFLEWAAHEGCVLGPVRLAPSGFGGGVGMFATRDIQANELIFSVPKRIHLGLDTALADVDCGDDFEEGLLDGTGVSALSAFIAKLHLCRDPRFSPFLDSLNVDTAEHVQFWSDDEIDLFSGTAAHEPAFTVREHSDDIVDFALSLDSMRLCIQQSLSSRGLDCNATELNRLIAESVRAAHCAVMSRGIDSDVPGGRLLVPLLDKLQHSESASIDFFDESTGSSEMSKVARATRAISAGEELLISYGYYPIHVFAIIYGFVPSVSLSNAEVRDQCLLSLGKLNESDSGGAEIALNAQLLANDVVNGLEVLGEEVQLELVQILAESGANYPLLFYISNEMIDEAIADAAAGRKTSIRQDAAALVASTRLCALGSADIQTLGGESNDWESQQDSVLRQLLYSDDGRLSHENDRKAAQLLRKAAKEQLQRLEKRTLTSEPSASALSAPRDACVRLAQTLRDSESLVLRRLACEDAADRIFGCKAS